MPNRIGLKGFFFKECLRSLERLSFTIRLDCDRLFKSGDIASISLFWVQVDSVIFGWFLLIDSFLLELPEM
jgi:hypothetical protein